MDPEGDLYAVLQVDPRVGREVIESAYRRLALKYHPDLNNDSPEAERRMKELNRAHEILVDTARRARYDLNRATPELAVTPGEVLLRDVDPSAESLTFTVHVRQVAGPAFDPARHHIQLHLMPPWDGAEIHWRWSQGNLPADVEFTLDVSRMRFDPGRRLSGDIELQVTAV